MNSLSDSAPPHSVAILALHGVVPFDLAIPCEVFGRVRLEQARDAYRVRVCGEARTVRSGAFDLHTRWDLRQLAGADTVIVPGIADAAMPVDPQVIDALREAAAAGARIASICSGAFVLAASGLLDGARATTHWLAAAELARRYPRIDVDPNVLFIDAGRILTSAGAAAGIDLCLHMVRQDFGAAVAADAARLAVMPLERAGGQAQFIVHAPPASTLTLQPLLHWIEEHAHQPLTLAQISRQAALTGRTLSRRFLEQTGTTALQWLLAARVRRAQHLLLSTTLTIEQVAAAAGFGSSAALRERFAKLVGTSPLLYRRSFAQADAGESIVTLSAKK